MSLTIKPLVWTHHGEPDEPSHPGVYIANHGGCRFYIHVNDGFVLSSLVKRGEVPLCYPTLAAAQQAAQEQWDGFIRAAVEETP